MQTILVSPPDDFPRIPETSMTRRRLLKVSLLSIALLGVACSSQTTSAQLAPTPAPSTSSPGGVATATTAATSQTVAPTVTSSSTTSVAASPTGVPASPTLSGATLTPTDASIDPGEVTPAVTEGPYFKANSPERASLLGTGVVGTPLTLTGQVVSTKGQPIARALLDFWQADGRGNYDNTGYLLRGHQFTDAEGSYKLETVVPGLYPGRTRHIHVKVQAPNGPILTTQLFFPGEPGNASDSIFNSKLLIAEKDGPNATKLATFRFVVNVG